MTRGSGRQAAVFRGMIEDFFFFYQCVTLTPSGVKIKRTHVLLCSRLGCDLDLDVNTSIFFI